MGVYQFHTGGMDIAVYTKNGMHAQCKEESQKRWSGSCTQPCSYTYIYSPVAVSLLLYRRT